MCHNNTPRENISDLLEYPFSFSKLKKYTIINIKIIIYTYIP